MLKCLKTTVCIAAFACSVAISASASTPPSQTVQQQIETCQKNYTAAMQRGDIAQASKEAQKISHLRMGNVTEKPATVSKR